MRNPGRAPKTLDSAALLHPGYVPINGVRPEWHLLKARTTVILAQAGIQNC